MEEKVRNPEKRLANSQAHCYGIGDFYTQLTAKTFGGEIVPQGNNHRADIDHEPWDAQIEVKGAGNSNGIMIFTSQLEEHLEELGSQREHCLYALWRYNRKNHFPNLRISRCETVRQLYDALAERTLDLHVVDARLLNALCYRNGTNKERRDNRRAETLWIWLHTLEDLVQSLPLLTNVVGFRRGHFKVIERRITTVFESRVVNFRATFVVPRIIRSAVLRQLPKTTYAQLPLAIA